jgi:hypothetical protein
LGKKEDTEQELILRSDSEEAILPSSKIRLDEDASIASCTSNVGGSQVYGQDPNTLAILVMSFIGGLMYSYKRHLM